MIEYSFKQMEEVVKKGSRQRLALAAAHSEEALAAVDEAVAKGVVEAILVGEARLIEETAQRLSIDLSRYELIDVEGERAAADRAVELVRQGRAHLLMKGLVETSDFLRAVLSSSTGIKAQRRFCSAVALECTALDRIVILADVGANISPNLEEKADIIENCALVAAAFGVERPKAAVLCAHEKVQPEAMPLTAEAALLSKMAQRGQIKGNVLVEGPISMDLAVDKHSAEVKKFDGTIQGNADILLAPNLETGNILVKGLMYLTKDVRTAGVGMGAKVPLVLSSRGDNRETKYYSIVLASLISQQA